MPFLLFAEHSSHIIPKSMRQSQPGMTTSLLIFDLGTCRIKIRRSTLQDNLFAATHIHRIFTSNK
jgi:hypothetical protein